MFTKTHVKSAALAVLVIWGLNQFDQTKDLINGNRSFF